MGSGSLPQRKRFEAVASKTSENAFLQCKMHLLSSLIFMQKRRNLPSIWFCQILKGSFAPTQETEEPHASTPSKRQSTLDCSYSGPANLKIEVLASNSTVKFQTEVQDVYALHVNGPVEQCNLIAEAQNNRLLRASFHGA